MNIYDFAGNEWEWTLEHATSSNDYPYAYRGGSCSSVGSGGPATNRNDNNATYSNFFVGFRTTIYIK